jgi:hypothetical protein
MYRRLAVVVNRSTAMSGEILGAVEIASAPWWGVVDAGKRVIDVGRRRGE